MTYKINCLVVLLALVVIPGIAKAYSKVTVTVPYRFSGIDESISHVGFVCEITRESGQTISTRRSAALGVVAAEETMQGEAVLPMIVRPWFHYFPTSNIVGTNIRYTCNAEFVREDNSKICTPSTDHENPICRVDSGSTVEVTGSFLFQPQ